MMRIDIDAVLFDCDGVLVDSLESAAHAWDAWSARYAPGFDFRTQIEHGVRAADTVATLVAADILPEAVRALEDIEVERATETLAISGARSLTASIPSGRWAVVTSGVRRLALARLAAAGIAVPPAVVSAEDVRKGKPDPAPYLLGADLLGTEPGRCAVFEDAPAGVRAARAAGVKAVIGVGDHLGDAPVDALVPDLSTVRFTEGALLIGS